MSQLDLLASEKTRRELLLLMPSFDVLDPENRQKAYVAAAWSFVRAGDLEEALKLLDLLTPEYVQNVMPGQMERDPAFDKMCEVVTRALVEANVYVPIYHPEHPGLVVKTGLS